DQSRAELGDLAADIGLHVICELGAAAIGLAQMYFGAALGEARYAALPFAGDRVAVRRIDVGQCHLALEGRLDRTDGDFGSRAKRAVAFLHEFLAPRDAGLEYFMILQL